MLKWNKFENLSLVPIKTFAIKQENLVAW